MFARLVALLIIIFARLITAVRAIWLGSDPVPEQRVYFANHASNGDFVLIWSVLPGKLRNKTRPVAAADYWLTTKLKTFIGRSVFNAVLIDRNPETRAGDPVQQMADALQAGDSLILFPEGTRNMTQTPLLPFKTGLFHLAKQRPDIDLVPVWIENLNRVMPKGKLIPIPLVCTITFGQPMRVQQDETKADFLERAQSTLLALSETARE
ncbi:lysophospholipid acyltransferase family protein [Sedimentitalea todarodis]|uniref:Lysophospholipid acyltransferase family protein n=1 Tax=Sedimentitalea todarodis TaxID=1631240 RepID=A0ABU3VE46_9RHOB|nr:lysophospholipid acyltransferase family protein [Sedimentitalea todarodis]MDU9004442.1 lysophospholipid acyltransferase family protein [Sedimentitalea todarodis]